MLAILVMALLASAAAYSFAAPLRAARARQVVDQLMACDAAARRYSRDSGRVERLSFDPVTGVVDRYAGAQLQFREVFPSSIRIEDVFVNRRIYRKAQADIDFSISGFSPTYAVHVVGPGLDRWVLFAGLSGETSVVADEEAVRSAIENNALPARHNLD